MHYNLPNGDVTTSGRRFLRCDESNFGSQVVHKKKSSFLNCRPIIVSILQSFVQYVDPRFANVSTLKFNSISQNAVDEVTYT